MKKVLWVLSSLALVGMGFVGCDDEGGCKSNDDCSDGQICAAIKGGDAECVDTSKISRCLADGGKALKNCKILNKDTNGDYQCVTDDVKCTNYCESDDQCSSKSCDTKTNTCNAVKTDVWKFVRIDDMSDSSAVTGKSDPGVDIDAIVLVKGGASNGAKKYAKAVTAFQRGDAVSAADKKIYAGDENAILGAPDSMTTYGGSSKPDCKYFQDGSNSKNEKNCDPDKKGNTGFGKTAAGADCDFKYTFVSLGGPGSSADNGGYIIVEMEDVIEKDDKLDIVEIGDCNLINTAGGGTYPAGAEKMKVRVSVSGDAGASFKALTGGEGVASRGVFSINIDKDPASL